MAFGSGVSKGAWPLRLKNILNSIIGEMAENPGRFARNPSVDFTRNRKLTFIQLSRLLLSMGGNSLNKELFDHFTPSSAPTVSALVQQRAKLKPKAMEHLFHQFNIACDDARKYRGCRLLAIDGTTMTYKGYPDEDTRMECNHGMNQFHVNLLYDVLNKVCLDAVIQPKPKENEPQGAKELVHRLDCGPAIILADRNYGALNLIEHLRRAPDVEYVVRLKNGHWKELEKLPMACIDTNIEIRIRTFGKRILKPGNPLHDFKYIHPDQWDFEPKHLMKLRIVRFEIGDGEYETIATSLPASKFPLAEIKKLYHMRWGIETGIRELKYAMGTVNFHSRKREYVLQEIFARLTMYNFCQRVIMNVIIRQKRRKWLYQVNFTMGIYLCRRYYRQHDPPDVEKAVSEYILPIRPDRQDKRKMAPRAQMHFLYRVA